MNARDITEAVAGLGLATVHLDEGREGMTPPTHARLEFLQEMAASPGALAGLLAEGSPGHKYATTQLDLPPPVAYRVLRMGRSIPDALLAGDGREHAPHVTLLYGIGDGDLERVHAVLSGEAPVALRFGVTACFPAKASDALRGGESHDVVYLSVHSPALSRLHQILAKAIPHKSSHPTYKPHVTLAYVRAGEGRRFIGSRVLLGRELTVKEVTFRRTDGSAWSVVLGGEKPPEKQEVKTPAPEPAQPEPESASPPAPETPSPEPVPSRRDEEAEDYEASAAFEGPLFPPPPKRVVREIERDAGGLMKRITEWEE